MVEPRHDPEQEMREPNEAEPQESIGANRFESDDGGEHHQTRRATGMGNPGTFPDDHGPVTRARRAASGKLDEAADRVRQLGDDAAARNRILGRTRPLAYNAAGGIESAADYVRSHDVGEMRTDLETEIRRHPIAAVIVAFFAGYTLRRIF